MKKPTREVTPAEFDELLQAADARGEYPDVFRCKVKCHRDLDWQAARISGVTYRTPLLAVSHA